jgi:predicted enzyme related to lactoylglutathione lyase
MPSSFCYSELHTKNLPRAKAFYAELFGWTFQDIPGMPYSMLDTGDGKPNGAMTDQDVLDGPTGARLALWEPVKK